MAEHGFFLGRVRYHNWAPNQGEPTTARFAFSRPKEFARIGPFCTEDYYPLVITSYRLLTTNSTGLNKLVCVGEFGLWNTISISSGDAAHTARC